MINQKRVILMTRMSIYEKNEGPQDEKINAWFRNDYLAVQFLKSFICGTAAFCLLAFVYCIYYFEELMLTIYSMDLEAAAIRVITGFAVFQILFLAVTFFVYFYRFSRARKNLNNYYQNLRRLYAGYQENQQEES